MLAAALDELPPGRFAVRFHDTGGRALANVEVALGRGRLRHRYGGPGRLPLRPRAPGNVPTEALADLLEALGLSTGLDREALARAAAMARGLA